MSLQSFHLGSIYKNHADLINKTLYMQIILCVNNRSFYNQKTEVICKTIHLRHYGLVKFCLVSATISCHVEMISGRNSLLWPSWLGQTTYFSLDQLIQTSFCSCIFVHPYNFRWLIQRTKTVQRMSITSEKDSEKNE